MPGTGFALRRLRSATGFLALVLVLTFGAAAAAADYRVEPGDVIELWLGTGTDAPHRVTVQVDGTLTYPQLGTITVAGLYPAEIRTKIQAALLGKPMQVRGGDGRVISVMISPDDVAASVVEYRPVYLTGDVAKPGQYPFHPAMTVQQAIAIAGGYNVLQAAGQNAAMVTSDLQSESDAITVQLAGLDVRIARLKAELTGQDTVARTVPADLKVPQATLSALVNAETELFNTRNSDFLRQKDFFLQSLKKSDAAIASLTEQLKQEGQGADADAQDLENLTTLFKKGNTTGERLADLRRAVLQSATRKLQVSVQLFQAKQQQEEFQKQLDELETHRKIALLTELQDGTIKENDLRSKLQGVREKLVLLSGASTQHMRASGARRAVVVFRKLAGGPQRQAVEEDFELQPGDVIEVALAADDSGGAPVR